MIHKLSSLPAHPWFCSFPYSVSLRAQLHARCQGRRCCSRPATVQGWAPAQGHLCSVPAFSPLSDWEPREPVGNFSTLETLLGDNFILVFLLLCFLKDTTLSYQILNRQLLAPHILDKNWTLCTIDSSSHCYNALRTLRNCKNVITSSNHNFWKTTCVHFLILP